MVDDHFLEDEMMAARLVELADLRPTDIVFEVGAGEGFLTRFIARKAHVIAVEKNVSRRLWETKNENISVIFGDAIVEIPNIIFNKIVSNPPFTLLESLLRALIHKEFSIAILVAPRSFLAKMNKDFFYSALFHFQEAFTIPSSSFSPPPRTDTIALVIRRRVDERSEFAERLFSFRGKAKNFIKGHLEDRGMTKREAQQKLRAFNLSEKILEKESRLLMPDEMAEVYKRISEE